LRPFGRLEFVVADAAKGLAGGVQRLASERSAQGAASLTQGLDVFHTAQQAQRALAGPWRQAEAAWQQAEAADRAVAAAQQQGQDARHVSARAWRAWQKAEQALAAVERQEAAWRRAQAALVVFRPDGQLNDRVWAEGEIAAAVKDLPGKTWQRVRNFLTDRRGLAFVDRLQAQLAVAEPDPLRRAAWCRRWWLRHRPQPAAPSTAASGALRLVEEVVRQRPLAVEEQASYQRVAAVLSQTVRASSAVEGINSILRMHQGRHRRMTQGLLDLKRLYWNCRCLQTGKRQGRCPYEGLGLRLPSYDFWTLLQTAPQKLTQEVSTSKLLE
jgi:hypothetical protein